MSAQDESETNYWPGYVDALTTMTMVLTFVMMILAIGIYILSESLSKTLLTELLREADVEVSDQATQKEVRDTLVETLTRLNHEHEEGYHPVERVQQELRVTQDDNAREVYAAPVQTPTIPERDVAARSTGSVLKVTYEDAQTQLDEDSRAEIRQFVSSSDAIREARTILIRAHAAPIAGGATQARRLAYYRAMLLRNEMIRLGIEPRRLRVEVDETPDVATGQSAEIFATQ
ncbi:hypothetical protein ACKTEK_15920 [Tepidamorphus sp. 3E244]|uniref:hypothetical protein n=1 Tax=Tepidamorphus sp. 3E244 TaxID=3385498 RepID=UPI0038FC38A7